MRLVFGAKEKRVDESKVGFEDLLEMAAEIVESEGRAHVVDPSAMSLKLCLADEYELSLLSDRTWSASVKLAEQRRFPPSLCVINVEYKGPIVAPPQAPSSAAATRAVQGTDALHKQKVKSAPAPQAGARKETKPPSAVAQRQSTVDPVAISIRFEFNPPSMVVVGNAPPQLLDALCSASVEHCVGPTVSCLKRRPEFVPVKVSSVSPLASMAVCGIHQLSFPQLCFDEKKQTQFMLVALDAMALLPGPGKWHLIPGDGDVVVEKNMLEDAKEARYRALVGHTTKPEKPHNKYKIVYELFFVRRRPKH